MRGIIVNGTKFVVIENREIFTFLCVPPVLFTMVLRSNVVFIVRKQRVRYIFGGKTIKN